MAVGDCLKMGAGGLLGGALLVLVAGGRPGGTAAAEFGCRDSGMQPLGFAPVAEELVEVDPVVCTFPSLPVVAPSLEPVIVCVEEPGQDSDFASTCEDFGPCFAPEAPFRPDARGRNARSGDAGQAVRKGVEWLAAHQYADGTWPSSVCRACGVSGVAASGLERDHLGTALALRAMLLSGCLPGDRRYREVTLGLLWLRRNQRPTGEFAGLTDAGERAVRHFAATLFLAELQRLTENPIATIPLFKALSWQSAAEPEFSESTRLWAGLLDRTLEGTTFARHRQEQPAPPPVDLLDSLPAAPPPWSELRRWQDLERLSFQTQAVARMGGERRRAWCAALDRILIGAQTARGHHQGSWTRSGDHRDGEDRLRTTALCLALLHRPWEDGAAPLRD